MFDQIVQRVTRLLKLDFTVFREIEVDENATSQAAIVVGAAALSRFIGSLGGRFGTAVGQLIIAVLVGWLLWSYITVLVGTKLFGGDANFWGMARSLGYANAPGILGILVVIPVIGWVISLVILVLQLLLGFYAVRETLNITSEKAILTILIGWVVTLLATLLIGVVL